MPMRLTTVTNGKFFFNAVNLINSYKEKSFNEEILFFGFDLTKEHYDYLHRKYGDQIRAEEIENVCGHAKDPRLFFYKVYAIKKSMDLRTPFVYLDAAHEIVKPTTTLKEDIANRDGRLIIPYGSEMLKNKYWVTQKCFEKTGCDSQKYHEASQYAAGIQAWEWSEEHQRFVDEMYNLMMDIDIAGPPGSHQYPDGTSSPCIEHRHDQSVFSLLITKYGFCQDFDLDIAHKYGDQQTLLGPFNQNSGYVSDPSKMVIEIRKTKFVDYSLMQLI